MNDFLIIIISILCSAFFSGMEIAFVSSNKLRFEVDKKRKGLSVHILSLFHNHSEQYISTMLVGNNIALVIYGLKMGQVLEPLFSSWIPFPYVVLFIQTVVSTLLILFTAEFLPKIIFRIRPNFSLKQFALLLFLCYIVLFPIAWVSMAISKVSLFIFGVKTKSSGTGNSFGRVDLSNLVEESYKRGSIDDKMENDIKLFQNALDFSKIKLKNCIVPRTELTSVEIGTSLEDVKQTFIETGLSKILIYKENIDHIIGYIHSSALFHNPQSLETCVIDIPFVPESMTANRLLSFFTDKKKTIAVVVDEFGGTSGVVTLEDIIEEIFGEIEDEFDTDEYIAKEVEPNSFILSGRLEIDTVNEKFGLNLPKANGFETVAGLILFHHAKLPKINDVIKIGDFNIRVLKAGPTKIELVRVDKIEIQN